MRKARTEATKRGGRGTANDLTYSPDGKTLAVAASIGIYLYDAETLADLRFIDTGINTANGEVLMDIVGTGGDGGAGGRALRGGDPTGRKVLEELQREVELVGRDGAKAAYFAKLREQRFEPRDGPLSHHRYGDKRSQEWLPTVRSALFTFEETPPGRRREADLPRVP